MPILSEADHARVSEAVTAAEGQTSGEIVTVVTERSDGYTDVSLALAAIVAVTILTLATFFPDPPLDAYAALHGSWNAAWSAGEVFGMAAGLAVVGFLATLGLMAIPAIRFRVIPGRIRSLRVEDRAIDLFKVGAERRTHGRTGVLIYISMQEHRAEIVADEAIAAKVSPEVWGEAMVDMLGQIRRGDIAGGLVVGIVDVGKVLAEHFPRDVDDTNELPDRLIEL